MQTVVLYGGREVPYHAGIANAVRCRNPLCRKMVQTRPPDAAASGRPKEFCCEKCRYHWKDKRKVERKHRERMLAEEVHG